MRTTRSTLHSTLRHDAKRKTWPITRVFTRWTWAEASPATPLLSATFIPPSNGWACRSLVLLLIVGHLSGEREHRLLQRSEEHTSELQSRFDLVCRLLLEKKKNNQDHS